MSMIQMRRGERITTVELSANAARWAAVGARLDALAEYVDVELVEVSGWAHRHAVAICLATFVVVIAMGLLGIVWDEVVR